MVEWRYSSIILNLGTGWSFTPQPVYPRGERASGTHCIGGWVGPRAGLDGVQRRWISCSCLESKSDSSVIHPVASLTKQATRLKKYAVYTSQACLAGGLRSEIIRTTVNCFVTMIIKFTWDYYLLLDDTQIGEGQLDVMNEWTVGIKASMVTVITHYKRKLNMYLIIHKWLV
jgi:hypothetical protein